MLENAIETILDNDKLEAYFYKAHEKENPEVKELQEKLLKVSQELELDSKEHMKLETLCNEFAMVFKGIGASEGIDLMLSVFEELKADKGQ